MTEQEIREGFKFKKPTPEVAEQHEAIQDTIIAATVTIANRLPSSRQRSLFITHMEQAKMWANAALANHGLAEEEDPT